jgi:hypothetical protein
MIPVIDSSDSLNTILLSDFLDDFKDKFLLKSNTPIVVNQMSEYLEENLTRMYPKLKINVKVAVTSDNSIDISIMDDFHNKLKKYYPEALF